MSTVVGCPQGEVLLYYLNMCSLKLSLISGFDFKPGRAPIAFYGVPHPMPATPS